MRYPRPLTRIGQIELTTFCDLRCVYCPSRHLETIRGQEKMDMSMEVLERALHWCKYFASLNQQYHVSLTGIGETLLHPKLFEIIPLVREALPHADLDFSTNGLKLTDKICELLVEYNVKLWVSQHRPEKAGLAFEKAKEHGVLLGPNTGASLSSMNWAGQVDWYVSAPPSVCKWLAEGWGNILVDGRISTCCLDAAGVGIVGHVEDEPGTAFVQPFSLCEPCHMTVPPEDDD